jgi:hypothetical protein
MLLCGAFVENRGVVVLVDRESGCRRFAGAALLFVIATQSLAQVGPSRARLITGGSKPPQPMLIDQTPRKVTLDVTIGVDGRVTGTRLVERSGNGIFDERMRGYWKAQPFVPALDVEGQPREDTLRATNTFSVNEGKGPALKTLRNHSDIEGNKPADNIARMGLMRCRDFLWEFDFMRGMTPKANLLHEDLFHVPFAMFIAAGGVSETARDALIAEWDVLVVKTIAACRENPDAAYWKETFVPIFTRAMPYSSAPVP